MKVWRLVRDRHLEAAYGGAGGLHVGGRWMPRGYRVVYTSESAALAVAENLVHADPTELVGRYWFVPARIPDDLAIAGVSAKDLPEDWRKTRRYPECQRIGLAWHRARGHVGLMVPSAVVPQENNVLLNPEHPDFERVERLEPLEYHFDERLTD